MRRLVVGLPVLVVMLFLLRGPAQAAPQSQVQIGDCGYKPDAVIAYYNCALAFLNNEVRALRQENAAQAQALAALQARPIGLNRDEVWTLAGDRIGWQFERWQRYEDRALLDLIYGRWTKHACFYGVQAQKSIPCR